MGARPAARSRGRTPLGFHDENDDDERQCDRQFQFVADARDVGADQILENAHQNSADHGSERTAQSAEYGAREAIQQYPGVPTIPP